LTLSVSARDLAACFATIIEKPHEFASFEFLQCAVKTRYAHEQDILVDSLILLITESGGKTFGHRR
jgi:hypothetical protein